jgi:uncharacterized protein YlzI (FlbEa/FlbD family)
VPENQDFSKILDKLKKYSNSIAIVEKIKDYYRKIESYKDPM